MAAHRSRQLWTLTVRAARGDARTAISWPRTVLIYSTGSPSDSVPTASARRLPRRAVAPGYGHSPPGDFEHLANPAAAGRLRLPPIAGRLDAAGGEAPAGWGDEVRPGRTCPTLGWAPRGERPHDCVSNSCLKGLRQQWRRAEGSARGSSPSIRATWRSCSKLVPLHAAGGGARAKRCANRLRRAMDHEEDGRNGGSGLPDVGPVADGKPNSSSRARDRRAAGPLLYSSAASTGVREDFAGQVDDRHAISQAICEGACEFDFLRDRRTKIQWGATNRLRTADD